MRTRWTTLIAAGAVLMLALVASVSRGEGDSAATVTRMNLPGADDRPFSDVVVAGSTIYVAGTLGLDPETMKPPADVKAEVRLAMDGIQKKLELAGATMDDLVSIQVFCPDLTLYGEFNEVYRTYFKKGFPARAFVGSGPLLFGTRFEINGIAVK